MFIGFKNCRKLFQPTFDSCERWCEHPSNRIQGKYISWYFDHGAPAVAKIELWGGCTPTLTCHSSKTIRGRDFIFGMWGDIGLVWCMKQ